MSGLDFSSEAQASAFLAKLPIQASFSEALATSQHAVVPSDWVLFVSDVQGSTKAIAEGRYKEVNLMGASSIIAVLNAAGTFPIPYIFGGDGASFLVPPHLEQEVGKKLLATRELAKSQFGLTLRIGRVPIGELLEKGFVVRLGRFRLSPQVIQTVLSGDGIAEAERWMRDLRTAEKFLLEGEPETANYEGLECRWKPVKSRRGEMLSVIVMSLLPASEQDKLFSEISQMMDGLFGGNSPISAAHLKLTRSFAAFLVEARAKGRKTRWRRMLYAMLYYSATRFFRLLWLVFRKAAVLRYKQEVATNSDYRKFDGMLRMVVDATPMQRSELEALLTMRQERGEIAFGIHGSPTALMTCLIFDREQGNHVHLLDGGDGGYTLAAKALKKQLAEIKLSQMPLSPKTQSKAG